MYESITYKELKSLPRDQKIEALKELKALYPTQKKIAEKLGVNPANIYNMIAKYIKADEDVRQRENAKVVEEAARPAEIKVEAKAAPKNEVRRKNKKEVKPEVELEVKPEILRDKDHDKDNGKDHDKVRMAPEPEKNRFRRVREKRIKAEENLLITLAKNLTGEEAQYLFSGIGSTFLKNHDYRIEIRISEK